MWALSPLAMHRSYKATKSLQQKLVLVVATVKFSSSLHLKLCLPRRGPYGTWGLGGSVGNCCWIPSSLASLPSTPIEGDAGRHAGEERASVDPAGRYLLCTPGEGEAVRWGEGWLLCVGWPSCSPIRMGEGLPPPPVAAGNMSVGRADPLSKRRERGRSLHYRS